MPLTPITAGFLPLTDSLTLIIARQKSFAEAEGIDLTLVRETSWANIRDQVGVGRFDVAGTHARRSQSWARAFARADDRSNGPGPWR